MFLKKKFIKIWSTGKISYTFIIIKKKKLNDTKIIKIKTSRKFGSSIMPSYKP